MSRFEMLRPRFAQIIKRHRDQMGAAARNIKFCTAFLALLVLLGTASTGFAAGASSSASSPLPAQKSGALINIVAFGDSLTAGYGLRPRHAFPVKLAKALKARGFNVKIANAGVSGDTTAAGLARLDWSIPAGTDAVIVELGANDGLRGLSAKAARRNLEKIVARLKSRKLEVLIAGIPPPRNFGRSYAKIFGGMFAQIAKKHGALYHANFLQDVMLRPKLNQSDGLHPNPEGTAIVVANILPLVEKLIARVQARRLIQSSN